MNQVAQGGVGSFLEQRGSLTRCENWIVDDRGVRDLGQGEQQTDPDRQEQGGGS